MAIGIGIAGTDFANQDVDVHGYDMTLSGLLIGMFIHAHLILVFFRSHGNAEICKRYPMRFLAAPLILWAAINVSLWVMVCTSVLAMFWDVYHSGLQTFGFGRIDHVGEVSTSKSRRHGCEGFQIGVSSQCDMLGVYLQNGEAPRLIRPIHHHWFDK